MISINLRLLKGMIGTEVPSASQPQPFGTALRPEKSFLSMNPPDNVARTGSVPISTPEDLLNADGSRRGAGLIQDSGAVDANAARALQTVEGCLQWVTS